MKSSNILFKAEKLVTLNFSSPGEAEGGAVEEENVATENISPQTVRAESHFVQMETTSNTHKLIVLC